uniref:Ketoreductase domain-containing protein n=1 Tax=Peronospora matthiolae TaxID=2874970 RepID=A0AAV1UT53_9STRA
MELLVTAVASVLVLLLLLWRWPEARVRGSWGRREFSLDDKVVVITGAANGIGRRLAQKVFCETRCVTLVLLDIDKKGLQELQMELEQSKQERHQLTQNVFVYECDVADFGAVSACMDLVVHDVAPKHIGVLVNNAGVVMGRSLEHLTPRQIQKTFAVNTLAHFWTVKIAMPSMKKASEALLVTVSSVMGMTSSARLTDYCASKAAVNAFHEALRLELWRDNITSIRTLLVCPAAVDTNMFAGVLAADDWALKISRFCIPMLAESTVADTIYRAMRRGDNLVVSCASGWRGIALSWAPAVSRLLPVPLYDVVVRLGGGLHGMDTFVGRNSTREQDGKDKDS